MKTLNKKCSFFFFVCSFVWLMACTQQNTKDNDNGQNMQQTFKTADEAAKSGIELLKAMASNKSLNHQFPFTADEIGKFSVGKPMPMQEISFSRLIQLSQDTPDLKRVALPATKQLYPIQLDSAIRSTAVVSGGGDTWKLNSAGLGGYVPLFQFRSRLAMKDSLLSAAMVYEIPGLSLHCLVYRSSTGNIVVPDKSLPETRIVKGEPIPENEFGRQLVAYAKDFYKKNKEAIDNRKITD